MFSELNCSGVKSWTQNTGPGRALNFRHVLVPLLAALPLASSSGCELWGAGEEHPNKWGTGTGLCSAPGCIPVLAASAATALTSLPGIYFIRAAIFPCFPRSLRCIQAAKRAIRMETRCPDEGISNYFLADKSHLSASHLFA